MPNVKVPAKVEVALQRRASINIAGQEDAPIEVKDAEKGVMLYIEAKDSFASGRVYVTLSKHNASLFVAAVAEKLGDEQPQGYYVEWNGEAWQSVFPSAESEMSQLHRDPVEAVNYIFTKKPGVNITLLAKVK